MKKRYKKIIDSLFLPKIEFDTFQIKINKGDESLLIFLLKGFKYYRNKIYNLGNFYEFKILYHRQTKYKLYKNRLEIYHFNIWTGQFEHEKTIF